MFKVTRFDNSTRKPLTFPIGDLHIPFANVIHISSHSSISLIPNFHIRPIVMMFEVQPVSRMSSQGTAFTDLLTLGTPRSWGILSKHSSSRGTNV